MRYIIAFNIFSQFENGNGNIVSSCAKAREGQIMRLNRLLQLLKSHEVKAPKEKILNSLHNCRLIIYSFQKKKLSLQCMISVPISLNKKGSKKKKKLKNILFDVKIKLSIFVKIRNKKKVVGGCHKIGLNPLVRFLFFTPRCTSLEVFHPFDNKSIFHPKKNIVVRNIYSFYLRIRIILI